MSKEKYDHGEIEERWQKVWEDTSTFRADKSSDKKKYYVLEMFPYPSGKIHMGHVRNYSIGDVLARYLKMKGYNVLHPMGWDSFGLPAENAAKERGIHPAGWTHDNIAKMRTQLKRLGLGYDWDREIATCTPEYYRWSQWFFLKFLEKGLAYKKRSSVNWCPDCETVLANEQVEEGLCWRCSSLVEDRELDQWFFKITEYADELLDFTDKLPGWPEMVLAAQRNWIGRSTGASVRFPIEGSEDSQVEVFTTRPDTLYGVTFMSLAPEHPLVCKLATDDNSSKVNAFVEKVKREKAVKDPGELDKEGVFTGSYCLNPLTGDRVPVFVANFVLMGYGTGAVMAVPAHDERDFEFAREYELPIKVVINPAEGDPLDPETMECAYTDEGVMVNSGPFDGEPSTKAKGLITAFLAKKGVGKEDINFRLRDWGISRQRYWGCPIPVVYCDGCGTLPVPENELPVILPEDVDFKTSGVSPLETARGFVETTCPECGEAARRETDTMDTFVDSSWYFLRYCSPQNEELPFSKEDASRWMPVDQYVGGIEHAVMHLLYARFFTKAARDLGLIDFDEPFKKLLTQGMVCKETTRCPEHGFISPEEVAGGKCSTCGAEVEVGRVEKMSKSKKNVVDPDGIIKRYGADTTRLFSLFAAPPVKDLDWSEEGVEGSSRFLSRVWRLVTENLDEICGSEELSGWEELDVPEKDVRRKTHETIKKVTSDIENRYQYNTAISAIMELVNTLYLYTGSGEAFKDKNSKAVFREAVSNMILLLSPFAPHISEELWKRTGGGGALSTACWPSVDTDAIKKDEILLIVQINGKLRSKLSMPVGASKEDLQAAAMADEKVKEWLEGKTLRKFIYIPGRLVNLVIS